jgi:RWP-RK domain
MRDNSLLFSMSARRNKRTQRSSCGLQDAAKKLNLGLSVLKRVCRDIGLVRWPYRKRNSLANVISKTQRFLVNTQLLLQPLIVRACP